MMRDGPQNNGITGIVILLMWWRIQIFFSGGRYILLPFFTLRSFSNLIKRNMPNSTWPLHASPLMFSLAKHPQSPVNNISLLANKQLITVKLPLFWNDLRNYKSWSLPGVEIYILLILLLWILPRLKRFTLTSIKRCLLWMSG